MKTYTLLLLFLISVKMWNLLLFADRWVCKGYDNCGNTVVGFYIDEREVNEQGRLVSRENRIMQSKELKK